MMTYLNRYQDTISTVQLSPFGEGQWNRIVTYSPIYVHWTDMLMMSETRPRQKSSTGKGKSFEKIDLNTMKLDDELLLNELYQIRKAATISTKDQSNHFHQLSKVFDEEVESQAIPLAESFDDIKVHIKHHCSYAEPLFADQQSRTKDPPRTNQTASTQKLPRLSFGPQPQPSLSVQLRQSAITRENVLSSANDRRSSSPLSFSSSKRTVSSAHSYHRMHPPIRSPLPTDVNTTATMNPTEPIIHETPSSYSKQARARSTNSSRSTMHMLKTKNERTRQKQNTDLKTHLVEPWKPISSNEGIFDDTIPNSLEIMHKMCGPGTAFERNLRQNFQKQLKTLRSSSLKT